MILENFSLSGIKMPSYNTWSVVVKNFIEIHLVIDGSSALEYFSKASLGDGYPTSNIPSSGKITEISTCTNSSTHISVCLDDNRLKLNSEKFKEANLFSCTISDTQSLLQFWQTHQDFIQQKATDIDAKRKSSLELSGPNVVSKQKDSEQEIAKRIHPKDKKKNSSLELINGSDTRINSDTEDDLIQRGSLIDKISHKKVAFKLMDIFDLCDPPERFKIREKDENFISLLSQQMIEKQSISIDNAPTVIGHIDMDKSDFKDDEFHQYKVHIIDGNHSIEAQKEAYRISKNVNFRFRGVNIYCGLKEDEALLLGISRNEDTSCFLNFSDCQKVDLLRRRLYAMTGTPLNMNPPEIPKTFKDIFCCLLNLKTKKDIDGKYILKFLSTSLSNRCYSLYKEIGLRKWKLPASKFDCLRGLSEEDMYSFLRCLADSRLEKDDWLNFVTTCQQKQKKKKPRKDVMLAIKFEQTGVTRVFMGDKQMNGNCVCFKISSEKDQEIFLSTKELKDRIFGVADTVCSSTLTAETSYLRSATAVSSPRKEEPRTVGCLSEPAVTNKTSRNVKEFLSVMADERCAHLAMYDSILIEEESVETIPANIIESSDVILDQTIQEKAEPYFTYDAWMCVCNTLETLKKKDTSTRSVYSFSSDMDISPYKDTMSTFSTNGNLMCSSSPISKSETASPLTTDAQLKRRLHPVSKPRTVSPISATNGNLMCSSSPIFKSQTASLSSTTNAQFKCRPSPVSKPQTDSPASATNAHLKCRPSPISKPGTDSPISATNAQLKCRPSPVSKPRTDSPTSATDVQLKRRPNPVSKPQTVSPIAATNAQLKHRPSPVSKPRTVSPISATNADLKRHPDPISKSPTVSPTSATNAHLKRRPSPISKSVSPTSGSKKRKDNIVDQFEENRKMDICKMLNKDKKYDDVLKRKCTVRLTDIALVEDLDLYIREAIKKN